MILRMKTLGSIVLLAALSAAACGESGISSPLADRNGPEAIEVGNRAFDYELYETAQNAYAIAGQSMPERLEPTYNSANTFYRQDRFRDAIDRYDELLSTGDSDLSDRVAFNLGNALYEAGDHEQAIEMYKQALRSNPDDGDAKHNLELALAHLPQPEEPESGDAQEPQPDQPQDEQEQAPQPQSDESPGDQPQPDQEEQAEQSPGETDGEPQEGDSNGEPPEDGESSELGEDQPQEPIVPPSGLTEEEATRLLNSVGEQTEPLRNAIQRRRLDPSPPPDREW